MKVVYMECTLNYMVQMGKVVEVQELVPTGIVKAINEDQLKYLILEDENRESQ